MSEAAGEVQDIEYWHVDICPAPEYSTVKCTDLSWNIHDGLHIGIGDRTELDHWQSNLTSPFFGFSDKNERKG